MKMPFCYGSATFRGLEGKNGEPRTNLFQRPTAGPPSTGSGPPQTASVGSVLSLLGYYHPRVTIWIRTLRNALKLDQRMDYNATELDLEYDAIERKWVAEGFPLVDRNPDPRQAMQTIRAILAKFASAEGV